jgi:hypothetical protein
LKKAKAAKQATTIPPGADPHSPTTTSATVMIQNGPMSWTRRPTRSMVSIPTNAPIAAIVLAMIVPAASFVTPSAVKTCGAKVKIAK